MRRHITLIFITVGLTLSFSAEAGRRLTILTDHQYELLKQAETRERAEQLAAQKAAAAKKAQENDPGKLVDKRVKQEQAVEESPLGVSLYRPNFVFPYYYTFNPYASLYRNNTPDHQDLNHGEVKYQISFKIPLLKHLFHDHSALYLTYTQLSFWQAYADSAFFRETNYEPELMLVNNLPPTAPIFWGWQLQQINPGFNHQSNGRGGNMERSWNRFFVDAIFEHGNWLLSIRPWHVFKDSQVARYNPNITDYLGHGRLLLSYKFRDNMLTIMSRNNLESGFHRGSVEGRLMFPLFHNLNGYVTTFYGYGQTLAEYDHRVKSVGVGVTLNEWM